ncbi:MAG: transketolase family protein, partial [Nitrososphaerota archaeon]|nr:transketolase family protein [Nitrososphaerota archaeon]
MLSKTAAMRDAYGEALLDLGATNPDVVVVGADTTGSLKSGVFASKFPERFFNVGIAEQNLVSIAAGMALAGKVAFAGTYAIFVPGKSVDQIRNNIAYPNLNVKIVCSHGGISVGPDGASHQQVEDIAIMRAVPKMKVIVPADAVSTRASVKAIAAIPGPFYVRLT